MKRPALVGIVNLTPDSFSGDGVLGAQALAHAAQLVADGADILDIGAESTRPGAEPLDAEAEWQRLAAFLVAAQDANWRRDVRLSVDTRHAQTAARALECGVDIINDVGGLMDPAMAEVLGDHNCDCIVMHSLTLPADKAVVWADDIDPVTEILRWRDDVLRRAQDAGIAPERLVFDAGIGFGKTPQQSLALVLAAGQLVAAGGRWFFGHSRKSFLGLFGDIAASQRDALTQAFSVQLAAAQVPYLRVHDVAGHHALFARLCT